jgi:hypothetical protein
MMTASPVYFIDIDLLLESWSQSLLETIKELM